MKKIILFFSQFCFMFCSFAAPSKTDTYCLIDYATETCYWCSSQTSTPAGNCQKGYASCPNNGQSVSSGGTVDKYTCKSEGFCLTSCPTDNQEFRDTESGSIFLQKRTGCNCDSWETIASYPIGCIAGFVYVTQRICIACPEGTTSYSDSRIPVGSVYAVCTAKEGYYIETKDGKTTVKQCPANSTSQAGATSITDCKCNDGFYMDSNNTCIKCENGSTGGSGAVGADSCKCNSGYYKSGITCQKCPDFGSDSSVSVTSPVGATDVSQCYIAKGTSIEDSTGFFRFSDNCNHQKN